MLGVSVVLLAHQLLGIKVENSAETLGLRFLIDNPERLFWAVWLVWLWAFVCYVQLLNSIRPFEYFPSSRRATLHKRLLHRAMRWMVTLHVRASFRRQVPRAHRKALNVGALAERAYAVGGGQKQCLALGLSLLWEHEPDIPSAVNPRDFQMASKALRKKA